MRPWYSLGLLSAIACGGAAPPAPSPPPLDVPAAPPVAIARPDNLVAWVHAPRASTWLEVQRAARAAVKRSKADPDKLSMESLLAAGDSKIDLEALLTALTPEQPVDLVARAVGDHDIELTAAFPVRNEDAFRASLAKAYRLTPTAQGFELRDPADDADAGAVEVALADLMFDAGPPPSEADKVQYTCISKPGTVLCSDSKPNAQVGAWLASHPRLPGATGDDIVGEVWLDPFVAELTTMMNQVGTSDLETLAASFRGVRTVFSMKPIPGDVQVSFELDLRFAPTAAALYPFQRKVATNGIDALIRRLPAGVTVSGAVPPQRELVALFDKSNVSKAVKNPIEAIYTDRSVSMAAVVERDELKRLSALARTPESDPKKLEAIRAGLADTLGGYLVMCVAANDPAAKPITAKQLAQAIAHDDKRAMRPTAAAAGLPKGSMYIAPKVVKGKKGEAPLAGSGTVVVALGDDAVCSLDHEHDAYALAAAKRLVQAAPRTVAPSMPGELAHLDTSTAFGTYWEISVPGKMDALVKKYAPNAPPPSPAETHEKLVSVANDIDAVLLGIPPESIGFELATVEGVRVAGRTSSQEGVPTIRLSASAPAIRWATLGQNAKGPLSLGAVGASLAAAAFFSRVTK